ncbi:hypothetical protein PSQ19_02630 [Devosia algicola]|uniref:HTH rpiR-type domain-containing protein n=1 Tax=Devosia algicola TaxID=3026418 RepID=A0ABY7YP62_9HYPH|nr:hypothetical protein [Devosia algicola]WDR03110.1 hypothetical protein PSQ19_02630 [Devosia algicola]
MNKHDDANTGRNSAHAQIPDIISQIKDNYADLRPAERRVADVVLADVAFCVDASNAEIARQADVSEPSVTRFCRSIGCDGVRDFKVKARSERCCWADISGSQPAATTDRKRLSALEHCVRRGA